MAENDVELLGGAVKALIVKAKTRRFPGLLVQGGTLRDLLSLVEELRDSSHDPQEVLDLSDEIGDILRGMLVGYERALVDKGLELPYSGTVTKEYETQRGGQGSDRPTPQSPI